MTRHNLLDLILCHTTTLRQQRYVILGTQSVPWTSLPQQILQSSLRNIQGVPNDPDAIQDTVNSLLRKVHQLLCADNGRPVADRWICYLTLVLVHDGQSYTGRARVEGGTEARSTRVSVQLGNTQQVVYPSLNTFLICCMQVSIHGPRGSNGVRSHCAVTQPRSGLTPKRDQLDSECLTFHLSYA